MKKIFVLFLLFSSATVHAEGIFRNINPVLFIAQPETDLDKITQQDAALKRRLVNYLFDKDLLNHEGTKAFDPAAKFDAYYADYEGLYRLIDLNKDGKPELVFCGLVTHEDDRERLEIYQVENEKVTSLYNEVGHILAYKLQPNTGEILLYHHQYPCCTNASHNLNRLRLVEGKIHQLRRYFVGRDKPDMKGAFFPKGIRSTGAFRTAKNTLDLRWSGEVITKNAWFQRTQENRIAHYAKGAVYKVLAEEKGWYFVLVHAAPVQEPNMVINPANFTETWIYGWLDKRKV